eukprot:TRINITY_DN4218_c0_g1_i1.p1 TRINITY_DN4218_c0_g1~~TRINITY_DN4218_c0_g1_i1.p1  ORF type:complete len:261 (+),score=98.13 TRINITY_DN4218_c0_g1_i1:131-913(+)
MSIKIKYDQAMEALQSMFAGVDPETIHQILVKNRGKVDPTIEELLQIYGENPEGPAGGSIFDENGPSDPPLNRVDDSFLTTEELARKYQEKEDMKLAMALQAKYDRRADREERRPEYGAYNEAVGHQGPPPVPAYKPDKKKSKEERKGEPEDPDKKKKTIGQKLKAAKESFLGFFKKKKKAPKNEEYQSLEEQKFSANDYFIGGGDGQQDQENYNPELPIESEIHERPPLEEDDNKDQPHEMFSGQQPQQQQQQLSLIHI